MILRQNYGIILAMRVPNRVQKYLEIVLQCINGSEPIVLSGMYDCGLSYIFYLLRPQLDSKIDSSITPIVFDLSNLTSPEQVFSSVVHAIRVKYPKNINNSSIEYMVSASIINSKWFMITRKDIWIQSALFLQD